MKRSLKISLIVVITIMLVGIIVLSLGTSRVPIGLSDVDEVLVKGDDCSASIDELGSRIDINYSPASDCSVELHLKRPRKIRDNSELAFTTYLNRLSERDIVNLEVYSDGWNDLAKEELDIDRGWNFDQVKIETGGGDNNISVLRLVFYQGQISSDLELSVSNLVQGSSIGSTSMLIRNGFTKFAYALGSVLASLADIIRSLYLYIVSAFAGTALGWSISLIGMFLILALSAWVFVKKSLRTQLSLDFFLNVFIVMIAQGILTMILLGLLKQMFLPQLYVVNGAILLILILRYRYFPRPVDVFCLCYQIKVWLRKNWLFSFLATLIGSTYVIALGQAIYNAPVGYDSLAYHLPMAVEWLKSGQILPINYASFLSYMPGVGELLATGELVTLRSDLLVSVLQFP